MTTIYDAHNWLRRKFETGASMRLVLAEVLEQPGIIVFDGFKARQRRKDRYSAYKARRNVASDDMYMQIDTFEKLCQFVPSPKIRLPFWEADDVIATLVRAEPDTHFTVRSTDVDFLQLPNVTIDRLNPAPVEPRWLRLYKTVVGDASDNIPGIKGFGKGSWEAFPKEQYSTLENIVSGATKHPVKVIGDLSLSVRQSNWLTDPENLRQVRIFWDIVGLYDVPMTDILSNVTIGVDDPDTLEVALKQMRQ